MLKRLVAAAALSAIIFAPAVSLRAADEAPPLPHQQWSFDGIFGTYDRASAQRGFQVYKEVCSTCHPVKHLFFRDLADIGYSEDEVKAIASTYQVTNEQPNDQGEMFQRPARPSDPIPGPFPNDLAARAANNGALPPDLSMIVKAREGGPDYIFGLLTGYKDPPAGFNLLPGMYYNEYFPGHQIAMPPPLSDNAVTFADGTSATVPQMAHDVVTFLTWAAEPNL
jgi:ubiquinol-cytochrome c reductase cytochrome c1 subunit